MAMATAIACMVMTYFKYNYAFGTIRNIPRYSRRWFDESDSMLSKHIHVSNYKYADYARLAAKFDMHKFKQLPKEDQCVQFFEDFLQKNVDWQLKPYDRDLNLFERRILDKLRYFRELVRDLRDENEQDTNPNVPGSTYENATVEAKFQNSIRKTLETEQQMADFVAVMRLYQKCFVDEWVPPSTGTELYGNMTQKLLPFLTGKVPEFTHNNNTITNAFPSAEDFDVRFAKDENNIIEFIKHKSNGKGIVLSASSRHGRDLVKLIHLLRALDNTLPIQIVHRGDFSKRNQAYVEYAATVDKNDIFNPGASYRWKQIWPDVDLESNSTSYGIKFLPQSITFVNIKPSLTHDSRRMFPGFANKLLALFFTSFKDVLLLDADAVLLVPPRDFFASEEYTETGTFFFKDRTLRDTNDYIETNFFAKLFPSSNEETLEDMFNIPQATYRSLGNPYMAGYRHYQEAGVVAIDKVAHLLGVMMTFPLSLWKEPVQTAIWGEKEMYWLGLSMAGDENYKFNHHAAASVGQMTSSKEHQYYPDAESKEVCSTHPGHIDEKGRLLWMNSGFSFCKKNNQLRDLKYFPFTEMNQMEVVSPLYAAPLQITHAIVPPPEPELRGIYDSFDGTKQRMRMSSWKQTKDIDEVEREKQKFIPHRSPLKGWVKSPMCAGYYYCAYDQTTTFDRKTKDGVFFEIDRTLSEYYRFLGKAWLSGSTRSRHN